MNILNENAQRSGAYTDILDTAINGGACPDFRMSVQMSTATSKTK